MAKTRTPSRNKKNLRRKRLIPRLEADLKKNGPGMSKEWNARVTAELETLKKRIV